MVEGIPYFVLGVFVGAGVSMAVTMLGLREIWRREDIEGVGADDKFTNSTENDLTE